MDLDGLDDAASPTATTPLPVDETREVAARSIVPHDEATFFAVFFVGHTRSFNPLANSSARTSAASRRFNCDVRVGSTLYKRARGCTPPRWEHVDVVHAVPCADGTHAIFPTTVLGADLVRAAADAAQHGGAPLAQHWHLLDAEDTPPIVAGEWALTRRRAPEEGVEISLRRRFVFAGDSAEGGSGDVPLVHAVRMSVADFLLLARTSNPPWMRELYAAVQLPTAL